MRITYVVTLMLVIILIPVIRTYTRHTYCMPICLMHISNILVILVKVGDVAIGGLLSQDLRNWSLWRL